MAEPLGRFDARLCRTEREVVISSRYPFVPAAGLTLRFGNPPSDSGPAGPVYECHCHGRLHSKGYFINSTYEKARVPAVIRVTKFAI